MNKTFDSIQLFELNEYEQNKFKALIDVELRNAIEFTFQPLFVDTSNNHSSSSNQIIKIDESSKLLNTFRLAFKNITQSLNLKDEFVNIDIDKIEILFDQKTRPSFSSSSGTSAQPPRLMNTTIAMTTSYTTTVKISAIYADDSSKKEAVVNFEQENLIQKPDIVLFKGNNKNGDKVKVLPPEKPSLTTTSSTTSPPTTTTSKVSKTKLRKTSKIVTTTTTPTTTTTSSTSTTTTTPTTTTMSLTSTTTEESLNLNIEESDLEKILHTEASSTSNSFTTTENIETETTSLSTTQQSTSIETSTTTVKETSKVTEEETSTQTTTTKEIETNSSTSSTFSTTILTTESTSTQEVVQSEATKFLLTQIENDNNASNSNSGSRELVAELILDGIDLNDLKANINKEEILKEETSTVPSKSTKAILQESPAANARLLTTSSLNNNKNQVEIINKSQEKQSETSARISSNKQELASNTTLSTDEKSIVNSNDNADNAAASHELDIVLELDSNANSELAKMLSDLSSKNK
jgi:hypothetical protein